MSISRTVAAAVAPALISALALLLAGAVGLAAGEPWLFPSLGPTVFLLTLSPEEPAARPRSIFVGHLLGLVAGLGALFLYGAEATPVGVAAPSRIAAAAVAVAATIILQAAADARHPPAAATTMLIALGGMKAGWSAVVAVAAGVSLVAGACYAAGALRGRAPWRKKGRTPKRPPLFLRLFRRISANRTR